METKLKELCIFITSLSKLDSNIAQNKLSHSEVKALFQLIDIKGKGFLDLNDIYELVGKVSENQLFAIFKYMDRERTGEIGLQQMEECMGNPALSSNNTSKEHIFPKFYAIVDSIKDKPKLISEAKSKLNLSNSELKATYQYICGLVQSKYISHQELNTVFKAQAMKYGLKWGQEQEKIICEIIPGQNVNESKFIQCFGSDHKRQDVDEEDLLAGITCVSMGNTPKKQEMTAKIQIKSPAVPTPKVSAPEPKQTIIIPKQPVSSVFQKPEEPPSFRHNNFTSPKAQDPTPCRREFEDIQGNINGVLDVIQQRRQRLRQDSLERKKLIDDVMNRKRQLCGLTQSRGLSSQKEAGRKNEEIDPRSYLNLMKNKEKERELEKNYLGASANHYNTSSPKQFAYPLYNQTPNQVEEESYAQYRDRGSFGAGSQIRDPPRDFQTLSSEYKYKARPQTPQGRPQTPLTSHNTDISQILKKYSNNRLQEPLRTDDNQSNTLKQLCKSKSGCLYPQPGYSSYTSKYTNQVSQSYGSRYPEREETLFNSKYRAACKENVMKRAEEEAAKKIEQIERKARMKVLQRKNLGRGDRDGREWKPLTKKGTYY